MATILPAFETLQLQMPIFAPRLNITMLTRQVQSLLLQNELTVTQVLNNEVEQKLGQFIEGIRDEQSQNFIDQMNKQLQAQYEQFANYLQQENYHLDALIEKNKAYHVRQFEYLQSKIEQQNIEKHDVAIRQYKTIQSELYPNNGYQERVFSPYMYLNVYGPTLIDELLKLPMSISNQHQVVSF